ncbi:unnamed protein product [Amoebophrya sp. A25]|nr:unnamed protein product [Amoebophrya sp. A25]|eukprot:GSA25T00006435001.1
MNESKEQIPPPLQPSVSFPTPLRRNLPPEWVDYKSLLSFCQKYALSSPYFLIKVSYIPHDWVHYYYYTPRVGTSIYLSIYRYLFGLLDSFGFLFPS